MSPRRVPLLSVRDLILVVGGRAGPRPVDGVTFDVHEGEIVGLVGESGSGKTLTTRAILQLLPPAVSMASGSVRLEGRELTDLGPGELRKIRGNRIALIPQHASAALNPLARAGTQVRAALRANGVPRRERSARVIELLDDLGIQDPERVARRFPHELSGGQQQRVVVAVALAAEPDLLIADEPTSALDPIVSLQFLELLKAVQADRGMAVVLVTHDLGVIARVCDRVLVMYGGRLMEEAPLKPLFRQPANPYTQGLLRATPDLQKTGESKPIPGQPLVTTVVGDACPFAPRCPHAWDKCTSERPPEFTVRGRQRSACWLHDENSVETRGRRHGRDPTPETTTGRAG